MRLGLLVIALAACSASASAGASWPRPRVREVDGGESLAPRAAARAIASVAEDAKPVDRAVADKPGTPATTGSAAPAGGDKPAAATSATASPDEPITTEEIVIEVED